MGCAASAQILGSAVSKAGGMFHGKGGMTEVPKESTSAVKVCVAVRPLMPLEKKCTDIVKIPTPYKLVMPKKLEDDEQNFSFEFDRVIKVDSPAKSKFDLFSLVAPALDRYCQGFNATVLAYGQTGSGKTYTMGTSTACDDFLASDPRGVVPRAIVHLFNHMAKAKKLYDASLQVQYVEIYNDSIVDLLAPGAGANAREHAEKLQIREKPTGEVYVGGATEVKTRTREEVADVLSRGSAARATAAHKMNSESSRSHAIITLTLEQHATSEGAGALPHELHFLRSKLHLVDLAGSERVSDTGAEGKRFAEGVNINQGLLQLGNVVNALTEGTARQFVPYRNSKLTRLLSDSLGGTSETLFIACISPADTNFDQSMNTLRYASRARAIKNSLRLNNKMTAEEEVQYLRGVVKEQSTEIKQLKEKLKKAGVH